MVVTLSRSTLQWVIAFALALLLVAAFAAGRLTASSPQASSPSSSSSYSPPAKGSSSHGSGAGCPEYSSKHPFCGSKPGKG